LLLLLFEAENYVLLLAPALEVNLELSFEGLVVFILLFDGVN